MDSYDTVRKCCSGKKVCSKCWMFIAVAVKVLDETLRHCFGFEHLVCEVYLPCNVTYAHIQSCGYSVEGGGRTAGYAIRGQG